MLDCRLPHQGPELLLRDAGAQGFAHPGHAVLGRGQREIHGENFFRALDLARVSERRRRIGDRKAQIDQGLFGVEAGAFDADRGAAAAVRREQVAHLRRPLLRLFPLPDAGNHEGQRYEVVPDLVDGFELAAGRPPRLTVEIDDRAAGGHEQVSGLNVHLEQGAVAHACGVADRQRLQQDQGIESVGRDLRTQPVLPVGAHPRHIDQPLGVRDLGRRRDPRRPFQRQRLGPGGKALRVIRGGVHRCTGGHLSSASHSFSCSPGIIGTW